MLEKEERKRSRVTPWNVHEGYKARRNKEDMENYYVYSKENGFGAVSSKPQKLPLIKIVKTMEEAEKVLKNYLVYGYKERKKREKYHYGIVVGKANDTKLKAIECVEYNADFHYELYDLDIDINQNNVKDIESSYCHILSDEANVEVLEQETDGFNNYHVGVWWNHNMNQGSPIDE